MQDARRHSKNTNHSKNKQLARSKNALKRNSVLNCFTWRKHALSRCGVKEVFVSYHKNCQRETSNFKNTQFPLCLFSIMKRVIRRRCTTSLCATPTDMASSSGSSTASRWRTCAFSRAGTAACSSIAPATGECWRDQCVAYYLIWVCFSLVPSSFRT